MKDPRGSLVHVRTESGECVGCIEVGLYEIVRQVIEEEQKAVCVQEEGNPRVRTSRLCADPSAGSGAGR